MADAEAALGGVAIQLTPLIEDLLPGTVTNGGSLWVVLDMVMMLYSNDGVLTSIRYWAKQDFGGLSGHDMGLKKNLGHIPRYREAPRRGETIL